MNIEIAVDQFVVEDVRHLNESTYVLKFSKGGMDFIPGQHLNVGLNGSGQHREYSIYSGSKSDSLEILIKEVDDGMVSTQLKNLKKGSAISVKGPYGVFLADAEAHKGKKILFIASGTGIAPFHSFIMSNPKADYKIIHGIRDINEAYDRDHYSENGYFSCTSRGDKGDFNGRLTDFLLNDESEKADKVYLCGNSSMIYDAMDILRAKGYRHDQIFTEVYF